LLVLFLYVDDILVAYQSKEAVDRVFKLLKERYDVKDLGFPKKFLGMTVTKSAGGIMLDQTSQIDEILHRFGMDTCRPSGLPIAASTRFEKSSTSTTADVLTTMAKKPYRQLVGALLYLSRMTRPDIAFAVAQASQVCADPRPSHWIKLLKVLQYLCGNRNFGINFKKSEDTLHAFSDADWANDTHDRRSVSGVLIMAFGCPIHWRSQKQKLVTKSSTAAEFVAADLAAEETLWTSQLLQELVGKANAPHPTMFIDNRPTIERIKNAKSSGAQKTIDIKYHCLRDAWKDGLIAIEHCPTSKMPADTFTKALAKTQFLQLRTRLGVTEISSLGMDNAGVASTEATFVASQAMT